MYQWHSTCLVANVFALGRLIGTTCIPNHCLSIYEVEYVWYQHAHLGYVQPLFIQDPLCLLMWRRYIVRVWPSLPLLCQVIFVGRSLLAWLFWSNHHNTRRLISQACWIVFGWASCLQPLWISWTFPWASHIPTDKHMDIVNKCIFVAFH